MTNLKTQIKNVDTKLDTLMKRVSDYSKGREMEPKSNRKAHEEIEKKVEALSRKIDELTNYVVALRNEMNKK